MALELIASVEHFPDYNSIGSVVPTFHADKMYNGDLRLCGFARLPLFSGFQSCLLHSSASIAPWTGLDFTMIVFALIDSVNLA